LLPLGVAGFKELFGVVTLPGVAVAAFVADVGEVGFEEPVTVAEEGLAGFET
jgi:hypothetical protein